MASTCNDNNAFDELSTCLKKIRVPALGDNVHKDECCLSFDNQESDGGNRVFLHLRRIKKEGSTETLESPNTKKPKRLAIGVEGGFDPDQDDKVEFDEHRNIVILPQFSTISLDEIDKIPSVVLASVNAVLSSTSAMKKKEILAWDGEERPVSKHADSLLQLDNDVTIPPSGWKCSRCELENNLWLNLSDGTVLCGRRYFDGSGGNNHAVDHFKETGHPLAVKLGTITPSGADVYSYDEDSMVQDPHLAKHLSHFGINMMNMEKTEQTMTEMEIDLNERLGSEWSIMQEAGKNLKVLCGPGLIGLNNMGNSCYLNSTMQTLLSIPEFQERYSDKVRSTDVFRRRLAPLLWDLNKPSSALGNYAETSSAMVNSEVQNRTSDFTSDLNVQMCKLGLGLNAPVLDRNSMNDQSCVSITPRSFKQVVGRGHSEFSTNHQQDAHEFFLHLLSLLERGDKKEGVASLGDCFKFTVEERVECLQSKQVRYTKRCEYALALPVPVDQATNQAAVDAYMARKVAHEKDASVAVGDVVRAAVPFRSCIEAFTKDERLDGFWSSALKEKSEASKRARLATFPNYLVVQLKKFAVGADWVPKKLDVSVNMPDVMDLSPYRGTGPLAGEVMLPDISPPSETNAIEIDENAVFAISQMGFPLDRCRAAVVATGNIGAEAAIMWLMENPDSEGAVSNAPSGPPEASISFIMDMGFTRDQAIKALHSTSNNLERAADWIFSHLDELDTSDPTPLSVAGEGDVPMETTSPAGVTDGPGKYELFAFISHMGTSTMCGHYVCHIKKGGRWVIFNDEKVAESECPPKDLAYIYFYRRLSE